MLNPSPIRSLVLPRTGLSGRSHNVLRLTSWRIAAFGCLFLLRVRPDMLEISFETT
jgi:hypothetical protein